jgi:hypothetical protein
VYRFSASGKNYTKLQLMKIKNKKKVNDDEFFKMYSILNVHTQILGLGKIFVSRCCGTEPYLCDDNALE